MQTIGPTKFFMSDKTDPNKSREDYIKDFESCLFNESFIISYKDLWILIDSGFTEVDEQFSLGCDMTENFATASYLMDSDPIALSHMFVPMTFVREVDNNIVEIYLNKYSHSPYTEDNFFTLSLIGNYHKDTRLPIRYKKQSYSIIRYGQHGKVMSQLNMKTEEAFWYFNSSEYIGYLNDNYLLDFDWCDIDMENKRKVETFTFICDQKIVRESIIRHIFGDRVYKSTDIRNWKSWITPDDIELIRMMLV